MIRSLKARALLALALAAAACQVGAQEPYQSTRYKLTLLREAHRQWGLSAPVAALAAQVQQESAWNPQAVSRVGAQGLAQFMPATTRWWCERARIAADDCQPHNPTWALRAMVGYDLFLWQRVSATYSDYDRLWLALRGYNGGEAHWRAEARTTGLEQPTREQIDAACGTARRAALHCRENLHYPRRILVELQPRYAAWGAVWEPAK
ncbi:transglycosylase SLT domain-containing protein [Acidovorax sp. SUPP2825]|uniref:transglycosylase SLT domain-containing protein n=1 Tax=Acidovorax sp. SUPP2825 TaxID=2920879 RepID=UPI0023DE1F83|nr:transglycosylase SLT domain-containing protein [Acidovorax sp. SUPP2825]GKS97001.1 transglycosylase SLT domain-containing protein [Acidovorax sp. SUPP2825]